MRQELIRRLIPRLLQRQFRARSGAAANSFPGVSEFGRKRKKAALWRPSRKHYRKMSVSAGFGQYA
jgi:hypothetical protein